MLMWPRGANTCRAPLHQRPLKRGDRRRSPAEAERLRTPRSAGWRCAFRPPSSRSSSTKYPWTRPGVSDKSRHRLLSRCTTPSHPPWLCRARLRYRDAPHFKGWRPSGVKPRPGDRPPPPTERARTRPCWAPPCGKTGAPSQWPAGARSGTHISADDSGSRISFKEWSAVAVCVFDKLGNWVEGSRRRCVCVCVLSGRLFNNIATGCIVQHRLERIR